MLLLTAVVVSISLLVFLKRNYNQFAFGLRESPNYFLWIFTRIIQLKGWSDEEYCLRTTDLNSKDIAGYLTDEDIPLRTRPRPKMLRGVPHRQLTQHAPDDIMHEMHKHMESISIPKYGGQTLNDQLILRGKSVIEFTGADGLFLPNADDKTLGQGEFAHIHSNDGSFHMILHPLDTKLLIEKQWAELFPLAGVNILNRIKVPNSYTMIYAPQNESDLKIWKAVLNAAISYGRANKNKH